MAKKPDGGAVVITCTQPGFRRAGMAHPDRAEYPAGFFSAEQLEQLRGEPKLIVVASDAAEG